MKRKKANKSYEKIFGIILIVMLCVSVVVNIIQVYINVIIVNNSNENQISLDKYRDLQNRQIQFVKNGCKNHKTNADLYNRWEALKSIAANYPSYITVIDRTEFMSDILFPFVEAYCYRPYILLLGVDDIYDQNLSYMMRWDGDVFHFDESDFDQVKW